MPFRYSFSPPSIPETLPMARAISVSRVHCTQQVSNRRASGGFNASRITCCKLHAFNPHGTSQRECAHQQASSLGASGGLNQSDHEFAAAGIQSSKNEQGLNVIDSVQIRASQGSNDNNNHPQVSAAQTRNGSPGAQRQRFIQSPRVVSQGSNLNCSNTQRESRGSTSSNRSIQKIVSQGSNEFSHK